MFASKLVPFSNNIKYHRPSYMKPLQRFIISLHHRKKQILQLGQSNYLFSSCNLYNTERQIVCKSKLLNVMFFGTDEFSLESLKALHEQINKNVFGKLVVVTGPQKGKIHAVAKYCKENNLHQISWPITSPIIDFDIGIVVSFGYLIPQSLIQSFPLGILNVHGSLLPRWRGAAPIIHAVLNGDSYTGITVMKIHPHRFDVGEIIHTEILPIPLCLKSGELTKQMANLGALCIKHCLKDLLNCLSRAQPQPSNGITKAPKIKEIYSNVIWERMTPLLITRMFMAFDDYFPLWTTWHGTPVKLKELVIVESPHHNLSSSFIENINNNESECTDLQSKSSFSNLDVYQYIKKMHLISRSDTNLIDNDLRNDMQHETGMGKIEYIKRSRVIRIYCLEGFVEFRVVVVKGRKAMSATDFYNGFVSKVAVNQRYFF